MDNESSTEPIRIVLYATEVGSLLGLNCYCSRTEVVKRAWYRLEKDEVPECFRPRPDLLKAIRNTKAGYQFRRQKYTIENYRAFNGLVSELQEALKNEDHPELVESASGFVRTEMGTNSEMLAIDIAEANPEIGQCRSMQQKFSRLAWGSQDGKVEVVISGCIDCRDHEGRIVEIKTRLGRQPGVTATELAQLNTYLFLTGATAGYIVELYDGDKLIINPFFAFDKNWWDDEVIPALISFANDVTTSIKAKALVILHDIPFDDAWD